VRKGVGGRLGCGEWRALQHDRHRYPLGVNVASGEMVGYVQEGEFVGERV
jgi:hypothetical protein